MFDGEKQRRFHQQGIKIVVQVESDSAAMLIINQKLKYVAVNGENINVHSTNAHATVNATGLIATICQGKTSRSSPRNIGVGVVPTVGQAQR